MELFPWLGYAFQPLRAESESPCGAQCIIGWMWRGPTPGVPVGFGVPPLTPKSPSSATPKALPTGDWGLCVELAHRGPPYQSVIVTRVDSKVWVEDPFCGVRTRV